MSEIEKTSEIGKMSEVEMNMILTRIAKLEWSLSLIRENLVASRPVSSGLYGGWGRCVMAETGECLDTGEECAGCLKDQAEKKKDKISEIIKQIKLLEYSVSLLMNRNFSIGKDTRWIL